MSNTLTLIVVMLNKARQGLSRKYFRERTCAGYGLISKHFGPGKCLKSADKRTLNNLDSVFKLYQPSDTLYGEA
jgi:hypothetical protein